MILLGDLRLSLGTMHLGVRKCSTVGTYTNYQYMAIPYGKPVISWTI